MSKQTINIGASPNDGTGTPLRTSFDYTNQNFTELYTALGGGVGLPGATTQVIFNDGGTNLAGDAGLVYNKTTDALTVGGNVQAASATITGDLTVKTNVLKVDSTNDRVGIGTATPAYPLDVNGRISYNGAIGEGANQTVSSSGVSLQFGLGSAWTSQLFYLAGTPAMTLNSTGLGVGASPSYKLDVNGVARVNSGGDGVFLSSASSPDLYVVGVNYYNNNGTEGVQTSARPSWKIEHKNSNDALAYLDIGFRAASAAASAFTSRFKIDGSGNVGIGVTPSAWFSSRRAVSFGGGSSLSGYIGSPGTELWTNTYLNAAGNAIYVYSNYEASRFYSAGGAFVWENAPNSGASGAGTTATLTPRMTLDASGNLLVGSTATGTAGVVFKVTGTVSDSKSFEVYSNSSGVNPAFYCPGAGLVNGVATGASAFGLVIVNKDSGNLRSISAAGTINASGADYAEYMTKSGDFVIAKGDVAGIDANGKLTNVFADAVSFVVKSTDPSYVGNDKWSVDLEGDAIEAARQLVDRIAFAGQVPVNVTGAKAGDYIVPVVNGTAIKGIAVSNPTFEQYQIAVGKVIAIDADGRARIIVKAA